MSQNVWSFLVASSATLALANPLLAEPLKNNGLNSLQSNPMSQVTNVNQLRDVSPDSWAFEALRNLVERYGCIVGYPDRTFRGDRALTRWEFAAGLNACLNKMESLLQEGIGVLQADIDSLTRLAKEFETELAALGARLDNLEQRTAFLEDHQFSTTTQLAGEVIFGIYGVAAGERDEGSDEVDQVTAFGDRVRLELNTSFTGEDLLFTRLSAGNIPDFFETTDTFQSSLSFAQDDGNDLGVEVLYYAFPVTEDITVFVEAFGGATDDFTPTLNFLDGDGGGGAISAFGTRNPIFFSPGETGLGVQGNLGGFAFSAGYLAGEGSNPSPGAGLFNGSYSAIGQIGYIPSDDFGIAFTFIHGYNQLDTGTGTTRSNFQFFTEDLFGEAVPTVSDSYGLNVSLRVFDGFVVGAWGGYTKATTLSTLDGELERGSLDIWNWAVTLAFPDLLIEGSTAGIIVGMQPWVSNATFNITDGTRVEDRDTSFHIEAFYEFALTDNIRITPGIIVITAPDGDDRNSPLVIGTIRTTFTF